MCLYMLYTYTYIYIYIYPIYMYFASYLHTCILLVVVVVVEYYFFLIYIIVEHPGPAPPPFFSLSFTFLKPLYNTAIPRAIVTLRLVFTNLQITRLQQQRPLHYGILAKIAQLYNTTTQNITFFLLSLPFRARNVSRSHRMAVSFLTRPYNTAAKI